MRISDCFDAGKPVFSFEFFPPKNEEGVQRLFQTVAELAPLQPSFVSVTYGAGGSTREMTIDLVARIKREIGLEAMAHLTCVGHTAAELEAILRRLQQEGIENILALRGDPPKGQTEFVRTEDGFGYAQELVRFIRERFDFCLGAACYPERHIESADHNSDLQRLVEKAASGVNFLVTQLFFDAADYFAFVERARAAGVTQPIVPGIMPVTNVAQLERFTSLCGASIPVALQERLVAVRHDDEAVIRTGVEWAADQCRALLAGGAPGIHFYTLNRSRSTRAVFERLHA